MDGGETSPGVSSPPAASWWRQRLEDGSAWVHLARLARVAAYVGVPVATMLATGGFHTFGYWFTVWVWLLLTMTLGGEWASYWIVAVIALAVIRAVLEGLAPRILARFEMPVALVLWLGAGLYLFVFASPIDATGVRLPPGPGNLGALLVMLPTGGAAAALRAAARRLEANGSATPPWKVAPRPRKAEVRDEPIVAWRTWTWESGVLYGFREEWETVEKVAACEKCSQPPGWAHTCGVYSLKSRPQLYEARAFRVHVVGTVELSGEIVEHDRGYRSQRAVIKELWAPDESVFLELTMRYPEAVVWMDQDREVAG